MQRGYLDQLLAIDAAVIGDNDTHIVLALRIDKRTIADNHGLLLALSELAEREPARPPRWPRLVAGAGLAAVLSHPLTHLINWLVTVPAVLF